MDKMGLLNMSKHDVATERKEQIVRIENCVFFVKAYEK